LSQKPVDITPTNAEGKFPWSKVTDLNKFEEDWSLKPVSVKGIFDPMNEFFIEKYSGGEKGFDVVTPFYTHLNEKDEECGILVNRGWVPKDLKDFKMHHTGVFAGTINGLLYRGDP
jgi:cytochrome oxidase assembly protein ShyY1